MKYIAFWQYRPEDIDKIAQKHEIIRSEREKDPQKYPKILFPAHFLGGETKGFTIVEASDEQLTNYAHFHVPEVKVRFVPLIESTKFYEIHEKVRQQRAK